MAARTRIILLVHTDPEHREQYLAALESDPRRKWRVLAVEDCARALELVSHIRADLVIVEFDPARPDDIEFCAQVPDALQAPVPVVVLTAHPASIENKDRFVTVLEAPVAPADLVETVARVMMRRPS